MFDLIFWTKAYLNITGTKNKDLSKQKIVHKKSKLNYKNKLAM